MGSITRIGKATLEVSPCTAKQPSTAALTLYSQNGSPFSPPPSLISSTLSSPSNKHSVKCPITQTQPGEYNISFTPSTRKDQLKIQVGGFDVPDSPFTLLKPGEPVNIITGLNYPWGLAVCDNGDIVVAENGAHRITILNKNGKRLKTFGLFNYPLGVAISIDGHILVTDCHRLQKLTTDGVCVKTVGFGESGSGQLQFYYPSDIAVHPTTGQIFVADHGNNRIQVFTNSLTFSRTISPTQLSLSPQFYYPRNIAIDEKGYLYITDNGPHIFKMSFSTENCIIWVCSTPDQVIHPASLTILNNLVYVSESDATILVFDTEGNFQYRFEGDAVPNRSLSISSDILGNLYVSDSDYNKIVVI